MSTIGTLNRLRTSIPGLRGHVSFTESELEADPLTVAHAPAFHALREKVEAVLIDELLLRDKVIRARARIHTHVRSLDTFASRVSKALLIIVEDKPTDSLYVTYFGSKNLTEFRKPRLGEQFVTMSGWIKLLTGSEHPSLNALAPDLTALIKATADAVKAKQDAELEMKLFKEEGARKKIFDEVNETRKITHAELAKLPHQYKNLPADFPDKFFLQDSGRYDDGEDDEDDESSADAVRASIKELKAKLASEEERLKRAEAADAEKAAQEAAVKADKAALAAIEKVIAEQTAKANALKAKLESKA